MGMALFWLKVAGGEVPLRRVKCFMEIMLCDSTTGSTMSRGYES